VEAVVTSRARRHAELVRGLLVGVNIVEPRPGALITAIMQEDDLEALRTAVASLEHPRLASRLAKLAGKPIELFNRALPESASKAIATATTQALNTALRVALRAMQNEPKAASSYLHKALAATSGAVGGGFGLAHCPSSFRFRPSSCCAQSETLRGLRAKTCMTPTRR
jgi:hypothetical protein